MANRDDSLEAKVFRQHYDQLVRTIQDPESLGDRLFSRKIIGSGLLQEMLLEDRTPAKKSRRLLLAVQDQLEVNPFKFTEVLEALQDDSTLDTITRKLQSTYLVATQKPNLEDMDAELRHVHGWVQLGLCLDLPKHTLEDIHATHGSGVDTRGKCKAKMLATWLERCENPTWSTLIAALQATGKWATAIRIAVKYGIEPPSKVLSKGKVPSQIEDVVKSQQLQNVVALRKDVERTHTELHKTEDAIGQNRKELLMLEKELESMKEQQQSKEKHMGLLLKDKLTQQLELANERDKLRELEQHIRRTDHGHSPVPEDVRQRHQQTQESIISSEHKLDELELMIKSVRQASSEITQQLQLMGVEIGTITNDLDALQYRYKGLLQDIQQREQELDTCLLRRDTSTPSVPDMENVSYYNIMMCAGQVEVKLRQTEIEEYDRKWKEKEKEVHSLSDTLKQQQQKIDELEEQLQKSQISKAHATSSEYQYAYMHLHCTNEMKEYVMEHRLSKLYAENLEYKMQLARVGSAKCTLENQLQALAKEVATLKTVQAILQTKIEKPIPRPRSKNTSTRASPSASTRQKEGDVGHYETIEEVTQMFVSGLRHTSRLDRVPIQQPIITESQLLNSQFQLKWRRTANLPLAMARIHIVQINNTTYCGGGYTGSKEADRQVFQYSDERNEWSVLPPCPTAYHALVELNGNLTSNGGIEHDAPRDIPTNSVYVLEDLQWRKTMPPLATARYQASAITYDSHAIVCGGITSWTSATQYTCTSTVEVYSSDTNQWTMSSPLPFALCNMSIAIVNDMCYVIGGSDQEGLTNVAVCAPLPALTRSAEGHQAGTSLPSPSSAEWEVLPKCPLYCSTAAQLGGCVLALGGMQPGDSTDGSTDIHLYSRSSNCWRRVTGAKLPIPSDLATATTQPSGDIMLIGGYEKPGSFLNTVNIASIHSTSQ